MKTAGRGSSLTFSRLLSERIERSVEAACYLR